MEIECKNCKFADFYPYGEYAGMIVCLQDGYSFYEDDAPAGCINFEPCDKEIEDRIFRRAFSGQIMRAYQIAKDHGWHDTPRTDGEVLALIHCEISEGLQALRQGNPPDHHCPDFSSIEIELADTIIRIMDYAGEKKLDIAGAIIAKMDFNRTRPYKHGRKF